MNIRCKDDVDKFFDKFEDPAHEVDCIVATLDKIYCELQLHRYTDEVTDVKKHFIKKLVMKAYRLGKDHAYAGVMETLRNRK